VADADPQHKAGLTLTRRDLSLHVDRATPLQVRQGRSDLFLDLRLARTTFGCLPAQRKWLRLSSRSGAGGSNQEQSRPERGLQAPKQGSGSSHPLVSERKTLDPGTSDRMKVVPYPPHETVGHFLRSSPAPLDTQHGVKLRPLIRRLALRAPSAAGRLALLALALVGCGSREDLIIGIDDFTLERHDDFDGSELDLDYWELASHTFDPNLAWFSPSNAKVENGLLVLSITAQPAPANPMPNEVPKPYSAAEVRTRVSFLYGRFRARVRFAAGAGVVSAFWGFYDRYSASNGPQLDNQIVIESGIPSASTAHELRYTVTVPNDANAFAEPAVSDPSAGFHVIGYDWTPGEVRFYFDGQTRRLVTGDAASQLTQYQRLVLSAYPSKADWLSDFDPKQLPLTAELDWVEVSSYQGARP
jgi:endoglucanase